MAATKTKGKGGRPVILDDEEFPEVDYQEAPKTKKKKTVVEEQPLKAEWVTAKSTQAKEDAIVEQAIKILESRFKKSGHFFTTPTDVAKYLRLNIGCYSHEVFAVLFLDAQHQLIAFEEMFRGTITQAAVYPREIAKRALELGAHAIVISHNHPSGSCAPSDADKALTASIKKTMLSIDVRLLDHMIVSSSDHRSFASMGIL